MFSINPYNFCLNTAIDLLTIVAAYNCPTDSTVKIYLFFFLPKIIDNQINY
jgi:hypothetical protein